MSLDYYRFIWKVCQKSYYSIINTETQRHKDTEFNIKSYKTSVTPCLCV